MNVNEVNSSNITVQWEPVDCIHRNGNITGYKVKYGGEIHGSTETKYVITGPDLHDLTTLTIQVAAINNDGCGVYSDPLSISGSVLLYVCSLCSPSIRESVGNGGDISISLTNIMAQNSRNKP